MISKRLSRRLVVSAGLGAAAAAAVAFGVRWPDRAEATTKAKTQRGGRTLFHDPDAPVLGNPSGTLTMVEFFDYRCPYCRKMHPLLQRLLAEDHGIRFLAKEWPVFGGVSVTAAKVALAANWQGKFEPVNDALFNAPGRLDDAKVRAAAKQAGADMKRLDHDLSTRDADLEHILDENSLQAHVLGLQGTPGFVIGHYLVPGAISYDDLVKVVAQARSKQHAAK